VKLNPFERFLVNNPLRAVFMRGTMAWFWTAACAPSVERVLEIGCGQGDGVGEIVRRFGPRAIDAFDLDQRQVARARQRIRVDGVPVRLWVGDGGRAGRRCARSAAATAELSSAACARRSGISIAPASRRGARG